MNSIAEVIVSIGLVLFGVTVLGLVDLLALAASLISVAGHFGALGP
jgi:hypothetical protein